MAGIVSAAGILGAIGGALLSVWATFKYVLLGSYKLSAETSKSFFDKIHRDASFKWILTSELTQEPKYPTMFDALVVMSGVPIFFSRGERLFTAGWQSKEEVSSVSFLRWHRRRVEVVLRPSPDEPDIPISALLPGSQDRLGSLCYDPNTKVYLTRALTRTSRKMWHELSGARSERRAFSCTARRETARRSSSSTCQGSTGFRSMSSTFRQTTLT